MRAENLVREMAHTWVDGGGDEDGICYCLHQLRQAVRDEIQRRLDAEPNPSRETPDGFKRLSSAAGEVK